MQLLRGCLLALIASSSLQAATAEAETWIGRPLAEFLDSLDDLGVKVIFSSDLVGDDLRLQAEPSTGNPREALPQILAPFGLGLAAGPGDTLLVVRKAVPLPQATEVPHVTAGPPLPEIIVTSSLHRMEAVRTETHTYLDRELATRIPATAEEVVRVTARMPGTAGGGISTRNHVRGGEANEVLFLLDGLRLYEPFHLKNFQAIATIVNSSAIGGIDFYTGAYPARYGDRMSGVMNLSMRQPERNVETELALSFFNASLLSLGTFGSNAQGDWLVSARRGNLDVIVDIVDPDYGDPAYNDVMLHGGWEFGPRSAISLNLLTSTDKIHIDDEDRGEMARAHYLNEVIWLKWTADWSSRLRSETIFSHSSIRNRRSGELDLTAIVSGSLEELNRFRVSALKHDWTFVANRQWMLTAGIDARHIDGFFDFESTRTIDAPFDGLFGNESTTMHSADLVSDGGQYAVYAELKWQPTERLVLEGGARWDTQDFTLSSGDTQTSPRVGALYKLSPDSELRIGWGQFSQAQEVNELQVSDGVDEYFKAQRAEHTVANLKHRFRGGVEMDLSFYRKVFRKLRPRFENAFNPLTVVPELQFDRVRIDSREAESRGAEVQFSNGDDSSLTWWVGYAWSSVDDRIDGRKVRRSWDQTHAAKAGMSWKWNDWNFSAAMEAHTGWPMTEMYGETVVTPGGEYALAIDATDYNAKRHADFHTLDVRISREFRLERGRLTAFLDVTNLYNRRNPCCFEYSVDTDGSVPELVRREAHWLPTVPSLGIIWNF